MKLRLLQISLSLLSASASASGAAWLGYPSSARNVAEAGGLGVLSQGLHALSLNPAALAEMKSSGQVQLSHSNWAADIKSENLGLAQRLSGGSVLALAGTWVDFGAVQGYSVGSDGSLQEQGSLRPNAGAVQASWAAPFLKKDSYVGLSAKLLTQNLEGKSSSFAPALEGGIKSALGAGFSAAASVLNLGSALDASDLPLQARLGLAWGGDQAPLQLGVEAASHPSLGRSPDLQAAARLRLAQGLHAHLGWQQLDSAQAQSSLGLSFEVAGRYNVDYAFRQQADLGATHHIGLGLRWN